MSALLRIADSSRTSLVVRFVASIRRAVTSLHSAVCAPISNVPALAAVIANRRAVAIRRVSILVIADYSKRPNDIRENKSSGRTLSQTTLSSSSRMNIAEMNVSS